MRLDRPFRGSEAIAGGWVTARELRGPRFRPLFHDVHVLADAPADLDEAVRAALVRHPGGVVVGATAAALHGALDGLLAGRARPVELAVVDSVRPAPGLLLRRDTVEPWEVEVRDGVRLSTPLRTAFDVTRRLGTVDAAVVVETLARDHGVTVEGVRDLAHRHRGERGLARTWTALGHLDLGADTAFATRVRLALVAAGVPRPRAGHVVLDGASGQPVGIADLAWPDFRCALMCGRQDDAAWALAGGLVKAGWAVQLASRERFTAKPEAVVETTAQMVARCRRRERGPEEVQAAIVASWPSRTRRRTVTPRLYS